MSKLIDFCTPIAMNVTLTESQCADATANGWFFIAFILVFLGLLFYLILVEIINNGVKQDKGVIKK